MFARVTRRLIAEERPLLDAHGVTMWEYVALSHLGRGAAGSQLAMAEAIGYDKTRLIALLEGLEGRGLVSREPDSAGPPGPRRASHAGRDARAGRGARRHPAPWSAACSRTRRPGSATCSSRSCRGWPSHTPAVSAVSGMTDDDAGV